MSFLYGPYRLLPSQLHIPACGDVFDVVVDLLDTAEGERDYVI